MINIVKASAGSGKTYLLSHTYIALLLKNDDEYAYRHILAVTFTNKATAEMKSRILKDLHAMENDVKCAERGKAGRILKNILHDYSAFAVSTIDRFFQQTLRSFARELGQYASYQVELDREMLCDETVDTILDSLDSRNRDDGEFVDFVLEHLEDRLSEDKSMDIEKELKSMARQLKSGTFAALSKSIGMSDPASEYSRDKLLNLKKSCREVIRSFEEAVAAKAKAILAASSDAGVPPEQYSRGWLAKLNKLVDADGRGKPMSLPTKGFRKMVGEKDKWFSVANRKYRDAAERAVSSLLDEFLTFWDGHSRQYYTAHKIRENIYGLGIAARLFSVFDTLAKEKNVVCLDDSNSLLKQIIDGSDAPFIYEKTGVYIHHYLLDEFQDTSLVQWENFRPLLAESVSNGKDNLIVGDVKQSIYRWRDSDWALLDRTVGEQFEGYVNYEHKLENHRSCGKIIRFNNGFYRFLSDSLDDRFAGTPFEGGIRSIYSDVVQIVPDRRAEYEDKGEVLLNICDDVDTELEHILAAVLKLHREEGVPYGDIAVLVRKNRQGTAVAQKLIDNDIPVITEASLSVKNSITVRRLAALMSYVDNPDDPVAAAMAEALGVGVVEMSYHSLSDLCDNLCAYLRKDDGCRDDCDREVMYVSAFADYILEYSASRGNSLHDFLKVWADADPSISSPLGTGAVKILSIHKSKGLDFPYVIVPFLEDIGMYFDGTRAWCAPQGADGIDGAGGRLFHIPLNSGTAETCFSASYERELYCQCVDAINMMYVATTRASEWMLLLCAWSSRDNMAAMLNAYRTSRESGACSEFVSDEWFVCPEGEGMTEEVPEPPELCKGNVYPLRYDVCDSSDRLAVRPYAADYFSRGDGTYEELTPREKGVVLHDILSRVRVPSDLERSVDVAVSDGSLADSGRDRVMRFLRSRINSHPEFFPEDGRILTEATFIAPDGSARRPDRVVFRNDGRVLIVDYKFGSVNEKYEEQIACYRKILKSMGYDDIYACLWFVFQNEIC